MTESTMPSAAKRRSSSRLLASTSVFLKPYLTQIVIASVALVFTAALTLGLVQYVRLIVDRGFVEGSTESLNTAIIGFLVVAVLQAIGTFARFYWVSWLGERVTANIRKAVYKHIINLHPGYFEDNLSGEIQSRITTDTTLIQSVIGSSASIALRNLLMMIGGTLFLFITNPKLTSVVLLCIPLEGKKRVPAQDVLPPRAQQRLHMLTGTHSYLVGHAAPIVTILDMASRV